MALLRWSDTGAVSVGSGWGGAACGLCFGVLRMGEERMLSIISSNLVYILISKEASPAFILRSG